MPDSEDEGEGEEDEFMVDGPAPFEDEDANDDPKPNGDQDVGADDEPEEGEGEGGADDEPEEGEAAVSQGDESKSQEKAQRKRKADATNYSDSESEDEKEDETLNQPNDFSRAPMSAASLGLKSTPPDVVAEEDAAQLPAREQQANASGAQKGEEAPSGRGKKGAAQNSGVFVPAVVDPALRDVPFVLTSKAQMWTRVPMEDCVHGVACDDEGKLLEPFEVEWSDLIQGNKKERQTIQSKMCNEHASVWLRQLLIFDMPHVERQTVDTLNKSNKMACLPVKIKPSQDVAERHASQKFDDLCTSTNTEATILWGIESNVVKSLYKLADNGLPSDFDPNKQASINYVFLGAPQKLCESNPKWTRLATNGTEPSGKGGKSGSGRGRGGGGAKKQRKAPEASTSAPATAKPDDAGHKDADGSEQPAKTVQDKLPFTAPEAGKVALASQKRKNKELREAEGTASAPHSSTKTTASQIQLTFSKATPATAATTDASDTSGDASVETAITEKRYTPASKEGGADEPYSSEDDEDLRRARDKDPVSHDCCMKAYSTLEPYSMDLKLPLVAPGAGSCRTLVLKLTDPRRKLVSASVCENYLYINMIEQHPEPGS